MSYMWEEICEQPEVLRKCALSNRDSVVSIAAEMKKRAIDSVVIAARGSSDHAAIYGKYLLEILTGLPVTLAAPSVLTMYHGSLRLKNALVIGISQSGTAGDVLEIIRAGNEEDALTVGITNFENSPLGNEPKYHLNCCAGLEKSVAATKTFTSEMYLMASLVAEFADSAQLRAYLAAVPGDIEGVIASAAEFDGVVEPRRAMESCFVLARGVNYPIALEAALKLQETCYVGAKAFAISDFQHGPMAMLEKGTALFVFAPDGPSASDAREIIEKCTATGADIVVVSDREDIRALGGSSLRIPATRSDFTSPFSNVTVAQIFACKLAQAKGLDPDHPRMLHKVTSTF